MDIRPFPSPHRTLHRGKKPHPLRKAGTADSSPAFFTVEAALLMCILLPVLLSLIYLGFLNHDRGVLQASACETAALADNSVPDSGRASALKKHAEQTGNESVLASGRVRTSFSLSRDSVQISYDGSMKIPGALPRLFGTGSLPSGRGFSRKLLHPADTIRTIRGLEYLSARLKGKEDNPS